MKRQTRLAVFVLPLSLFAYSQGVSCRGSARGNHNGVANQTANVKTVTSSGVKEGLNVRESSETRAVAKGVWGGRSVNLNVDEAGAEIEFDCAHGRMEKLSTDERGNFGARGVYVREHGGPERLGEKENARPVRYAGRVEGQTMTLTVTFEGADKESEPLSFTLQQGKAGQLFKCR